MITSAAGADVGILKLQSNGTRAVETAAAASPRVRSAASNLLISQQAQSDRGHLTIRTSSNEAEWSI
jgi:hypothetical protein